METYTKPLVTDELIASFQLDFFSLNTANTPEI